MNIQQILDRARDCSCGKKHTFDTRAVEIGHDMTSRTGEILLREGFGKKLLIVADENTIRASGKLSDVLSEAGFELTKLIYHNLLEATNIGVDEVKSLLANTDGVISVGSGSLNDICRVAAYDLAKALAIYATAPSMDGFASDTAPTIKDGFKSSWQAKQPEVIIADTAVLAAAPVILKSAGFGDMIAKCVGLVDWRIARLLIDEYYCENIADITREATRRIIGLADKVTASDEETAGQIMEALVLTGLGMKLAGCSRPASGTEHIVSHYWECQKLLRGIWPDYHGRKVGVATVLIAKMYHKLAAVEEISPVRENVDWGKIYSMYGPIADDVRALNNPTITDKVDLEHLRRSWGEIRVIIREELPPPEEIIALMNTAGAAVSPEEINVTPELLADGMEYHPYMRYRLTLARLVPMLGLSEAQMGEIRDY